MCIRPSGRHPHRRGDGERVAVLAPGNDHERQSSNEQHEFAGNATRAEQTAADADFDSPLMRLAAGGRTN
jgi:hypothetical protein